MSLLQFSKNHDFVKLQKIPHTFICEDFSNFVTTNEVSKLDVELLVSIIKEDGCRAESEDCSISSALEHI